MANIPDSAVVLALSKVELSVDAVLDALRTPDPFGIRGTLAECSRQEKPNLAERALIAGPALRLVGRAARRVRGGGRRPTPGERGGRGPAADPGLSRRRRAGDRDRGDLPAASAGVAAELGVGNGDDIRHGIKLLWRIGRMVASVDEGFEDRPRGGLQSRILGKLPGIGVVGGFFDERKGIRTAAYHAGELVASGTFHS